MKKAIFITIFFLSVIRIDAKLNIYGIYYNNFILQKISDKWQYYNLNIFYLKFRKPSFDDYTLKSDLSFSIDTESIFNIKRLNFQLDFNNFQIKTGRFLPRWYYTYFFRPLDIFFSIQIYKNEIIYTGIDGIGLKSFWGDFNSIEYIVIPQKEIKNTSHYLNFISHISKFDFSIISGYEGKSILKKVGFGFKGDLLFTVFNETLVTFKETDKTILQTSTGIDYSYANVMFIIEYYYQKDNIKTLQDNFLELRNNNYIFFNLFYFEPMKFNAGFYGITNLDDKSSLISIYYQKQIFSGVTFLFGIYAPVSKNKAQEFTYTRFGSIILNCYLKAKF